MKRWAVSGKWMGRRNAVQIGAPPPESRVRVYHGLIDLLWLEGAGLQEQFQNARNEKSKFKKSLAPLKSLHY